MFKRPSTARFLFVFTIMAATSIPMSGMANMIDNDKEIFIVRPLTTEPAWTQSAFYFNSMLFDLPNAVSRPNAQVGFVFTPGFTWSILDILELNLGFPLVLNPDASGDQEKNAAKYNPELKQAPYWDSTPDFDLPGFLLGLKASLVGKKGEDRFFLALGVMSSIPLGSTDEWSANFMAPKTGMNQSNSMRFAPYLSLAYNIGKFSPQLQVGSVIRMPQKYFDMQDPPMPGDATWDKLPEKGHFDFFFNLALPFAFIYERTAPILEINGVFGEGVTQLFITPAVTFLPEGSPALLSFACQIPILDSEFRKSEGFRFLVNFSYRLDVLSIPALGGGEDESSSREEEKPPAGW